MKQSNVADFHLSGRGDKFRGTLVVASNREPYVHRKTARGMKLEIPAGGLVSALDSVLRVTGGIWVAWGSGSGDFEGTVDRNRLWLPPDRPAYQLRRVRLSPKAVKNYYSGFCNQVLWPLFHGDLGRIADRGPFWDEYVRTNGIFAEAILEEAQEDSTIWVHDYHLCLVPRLIREKDPERTIAHFWHIPWPAGDLFAHLPHGPELLAGLLGNDLIGFQIPRYAEHFLECAAVHLGAEVNDEAMTVNWQGRTTRIRSFPISTDFNRFNRLAGSSATGARIERLRKRYALPRFVGLAVDRLEYTKGISQRLEALDLFFRRYRRFRGIFSLIQVAVATRSGRPYLQYRREIEERIARINAKYGTTGWKPILYLRHRIGQRDLAACYRLADVAVITPLCDGMNLVAKEYVASRSDGKGVLILGKEAGAAAELSRSILVDPYDSKTFATAIHQALTLPDREETERMAELRKEVSSHTIYSWIGDVLDELSLLPVTKAGGGPEIPEADRRASVSRRKRLPGGRKRKGGWKKMTERENSKEGMGVIHGRFQVFHNDHLAYILSGMALCRHLVVGITNPDPILTRTDSADPKRSDPAANPLTYFERYLMVRAALEESGIKSSRFSVVPFPINIPELYRHYVPLDALFFLSIYDAWGKRKLEYFKSLGLETRVLREVSPDQKGLSATDVRRRMALNEPWEELVPPSVTQLMKKWDIPARLRRIGQFNGGN